MCQKLGSRCCYLLEGSLRLGPAPRLHVLQCSGISKPELQVVVGDDLAAVMGRSSRPQALKGSASLAS